MLRLLLLALALSTAAAGAATAPARIEVHPPVVELQIGERQRFEARVLDGQGNPGHGTLRWRSSGGRISAEGVFVAAAAGRYTITAATHDGRIVGTATAVVRPGRTVLGQVVLRPEHAVVAPGGRIQFRALMDGPGSGLPSDLLWSARGGRIDPDGLYVAGPHPGRFRVTVYERRSGSSASAVVRILGSSP